MEKLEVFVKAVAYLKDEGYEASVHPNYSGRGMYGGETVGIVTNAPGTVVGGIVAQVMLELFMYDFDSTEKDVQNFLEDELMLMVPQSMDSMGLNKIYY